MKKLPIILILAFSCSVARGKEPCSGTGEYYNFTCLSCHELGYSIKKDIGGKVIEAFNIKDLQEEIELLKAKIKELEDNEVVGAISDIGTKTVYHSEEGAVYYFSGGAGHNCGGTIDKYGISLYAVMCPQCDWDAINEIKGRHSK